MPASTCASTPHGTILAIPGGISRAGFAHYEAPRLAQPKARRARWPDRIGSSNRSTSSCSLRVWRWPVWECMDLERLFKQLSTVEARRRPLVVEHLSKFVGTIRNQGYRSSIDLLTLVDFNEPLMTSVMYILVTLALLRIRAQSMLKINSILFKRFRSPVTKIRGRIPEL
jgi:hypothetical protein